MIPTERLRIRANETDDRIDATTRRVYLLRRTWPTPASGVGIEPTYGGSMLEFDSLQLLERLADFAVTVPFSFKELSRWAP